MSEQKTAEFAPDRFGHWTAERRARIPQYKNQIVEMIRQGLWISEISDQIQVSTGAIATWRQQDRDFDTRYREAEEAAIDVLEREAHRRAMHGVADIVVAAGKVVMDPRTLNDPDGAKPLMRRTYSDGLMMFILKGRRREVYGDRVETDNKHSINFSDARARLEQKLRAITQRGALGPGSSAESGAAPQSDAGSGAPGDADA